MRKLIILLFTTLLLNLQSFAQEGKPGCNPKSCKPGDTKVEEAAIITELRTEALKLKLLKSNQSIATSSVVIERGVTDEQSLLIISKVVNDVEILVGKQPTDFRKYDGAKLVRKISSTIDRLK